MVKFKGINHLAMVTGDMEKTVRFYRDVLGMPLVATTGNRPELYPYRHYFFALGEGNTIAFFEWPGMVDEFHKPAGAPASGRVQFDHVSFNVESEEVLLELNPNPPKDTDGRREDSGRGWVRELQGRWPGVLG